MKNNKKYKLVFIFLLTFVNFTYGFHSSKMIRLLAKNDYTIVETSNYEKLIASVNSLSFGDSKVVYYNSGENILGFIINDTEKILNIFIENTKNKHIYFYLLSPDLEIPSDNLFEKAIVNLYSFYYIDYKYDEIGYLVLSDPNLYYNFFRITKNKFTEYNTRLKGKVKYPDLKNQQFLKKNIKRLRYDKKCKIVLTLDLPLIKPEIVKFLIPILFSEDNSLD